MYLIQYLPYAITLIFILLPAVLLGFQQRSLNFYGLSGSFLILLIVSIYRSYRARKQFEQHVEQSRPHDPHERGQERQGAGDVIDVEYTEETVDDEGQGRS